MSSQIFDMDSTTFDSYRDVRAHVYRTADDFTVCYGYRSTSLVVLLFEGGFRGWVVQDLFHLVVQEAAHATGCCCKFSRESSEPCGDSDGTRFCHDRLSAVEPLPKPLCPNGE